MLKTRIAVFVSGGGTNLQALLDAQAAGKIPSGEIVLVAASNPKAYALERAARAGVKSVVVERRACGSQEAFEDALRRALRESGAEMIILAGFMSILSEAFTAEWPERILNVHPSLIPAFCGKGFYGLHVHEAALTRGVKVTGATVHYVNEIPDGGRILLQKAVEVLPDDTPQTLQRRVMEPGRMDPAAAGGGDGRRAAAGRKRREQGMNVYELKTPRELLAGNSYAGRGIVIGKTPDGKKAAVAYFIMGRSANSRNRIFTEDGGTVYTRPFDESKVEDPSLIIYAAVRRMGGHLIVTNGDQTDTICEGLARGQSFEEALESRCFEPDAPNFTPRISGMVTFVGRDFRYEMSILKSADAAGSACSRYHFCYPALPGVGHFLHTYVGDGNPLPTFQGEPERMAIPQDIDELTQQLWESLNEENRISLYVRMVDLESGRTERRLINKNALGGARRGE